MLEATPACRVEAENKYFCHDSSGQKRGTRGTQIQIPMLPRRLGVGYSVILSRLVLDSTQVYLEGGYSQTAH